MPLNWARYSYFIFVNWLTDRRWKTSKHVTFLESDIILHLRLNLTIKNDVLFINIFRKDFWDVLKDSGSNGKKYDIIGTRNNKIIKSKRTTFKDIGCCLLVRLAFVWDCIKHFINIFSNWTAYQLFICKHLLTSVNIPQITQISDIYEILES